MAHTSWCGSSMSWCALAIRWQCGFFFGPCPQGHGKIRCSTPRAKSRLARVKVYVRTNISSINSPVTLPSPFSGSITRCTFTEAARLRETTTIVAGSAQGHSARTGPLEDVTNPSSNGTESAYLTLPTSAATEPLGCRIDEWMCMFSIESRPFLAGRNDHVLCGSETPLFWLRLAFLHWPGPSLTVLHD